MTIGKGIYLVDSGAQYLDGTTDVTRTIASDRRPSEMRERFTLVLKGHIAIARAVFPRGTTRRAARRLARGAAVGGGTRFRPRHRPRRRLLSGVHEGPQRISKTAARRAPSPA